MINEEALEAALLAKMVSSDLTKIDSMATERSSIPASRINMNEFLGEIKSPRNSPQPVHHNNHQQPAPVEVAKPNPLPDVNTQNELKEDIKSIRCNLEKINNNLTKIAGMFGKVFHNMSKNYNNDQ
jgi:hypothetical protein